MISPLKHNVGVKIIGRIRKDAAITWFTTHNPRSAGKKTHARFTAYFGSKTVEEYRERGGTSGDLRWDLRSGVLGIEGVKLGAELEFRKAPGRKAPATKEPATSA